MKKSILVVDSDPTIVSIFNLLIEQTGFASLTTTLGKRALETIKKNPSIPLVFLDAASIKDMPVLDLTKEILTIKPTIRIILMTGYEVKALLNPAFDAGIYSILYKPFDVEEVLAIFQTIPQ